MHVNVTAVFALTQVFLPMLQQSEDPSVIFTSSGVGRTGKAFWGAYAVSKFATEGLSQVLADEHRHGKLTVNCINPGATRTNMRLAAYPGRGPRPAEAPEDILAHLHLPAGARQQRCHGPEPRRSVINSITSYFLNRCFLIVLLNSSVLPQAEASPAAK